MQAFQQYLIIIWLFLYGLSSSIYADASNSKALLNHKNVSSIAKITQNPDHKSVEGRPIIIFPIKGAQKSSQKTYRFYIQGGLHGNENLTSSFVVWLANRFVKGTSLLNQIEEPIEIDFISSVNPDGLKRSSRYNKNSVNLNRNFSVLWGLTRENPGKERFSEPETKAIKALFEKRGYTAAIDIHGYINWIVTPSAPHMVGSHDPLMNLRYARWKEAIRNSISPLTKYEVKTAGELADGGAFEDWAFWEMNVLTLCLEMGSATRFAEIDSRFFKRGTDTFEIYEKFILQTFLEAIKIDQNRMDQYSLREKNVGNAKDAGSISSFKYINPSEILDILD